MLSVAINSIEITSSENRRTILHNVHFTLETGKIYTILGKNGSGKSTLISSFTNLLDRNIFNIKGKIELFDTNLLELSETELIKIRKQKIKYVFQDSINSFDHLKKFDYYFKMIEPPDNELEDLLEYFLLPEKDKLFGLYPYEVSGGMAQRISVCLALLTKPALLVMDEPTSAVDINISSLLCNKLKEFVSKNNSSVLLITQDLEFAYHISDLIAQMQNGTLSKFNTVSDYKINYKAG